MKAEPNVMDCLDIIVVLYIQFILIIDLSIYYRLREISKEE